MNPAYFSNNWALLKCNQAHEDFSTQVMVNKENSHGIDKS